MINAISETCEKVILIEIENGSWLKKKYFLDFLTMKIVKIVVDLQKQLFDLLDEHGYELVKKIVICYC